MTPWVLTRYRKARSKSTLVWAGVVALLVVIYAYNWRYFRNFFHGPFPIAESDLVKIPDIKTAPHTWVRVAGRSIVETPVTETTTETRSGVSRSHESAKYFALFFGQHYLIVKIPTGTPPKVELQGVLNSLYPNLEEKFRGKGSYLPFYLDAGESYRSIGYIAFFCLAVISLGLFVSARRTRLAYSNPMETPLMRRLQTWGNLPEVCADIEKEYRQTASPVKMGKVILTEKYIFDHPFDVYRIRDVVWMYKERSKTGVWLSLNLEDGAVPIAGRERELDDFMQFLARKVPGVVLGYSSELADLYQKDKKHFRALAASKGRGAASG